MEKKKEFLNEENYEKGKKKLKSIALIILLVGVLIGGSLIVTGIVKTNSIKAEIADKEAQRTEQDVQGEIDDIDSQIDTIDTEITNLQTQKSKLTNEKSKIFQEDRGFSDRYYAKDEEITAKQNEITAKQKEKTKLERNKIELKSELWDIQSGFNSTKNSISTSKYIPLYIFGAVIILGSCMIAGSIYLFAKRREITAFTVQQTMPLAQEGIEKMAPTVGNAIGTIGKGLAKGIKEGINEADENKKD